MKKYNVLFLIVLVLLITSQVAIIIEKYDLKRYITRNITIENIPLDELDRLLLRSQNINSSYLFKLNGLRKNYTYKIHIWVEECIEGKTNKKTILMGSINTFSTSKDLNQTYLLITFKDSATECIVFLENQTDIISSSDPIWDINSSSYVSIKDTKDIKNTLPVSVLSFKTKTSEEYKFKLKVSKVP